MQCYSQDGGKGQAGGVNDALRAVPAYPEHREFATVGILVRILQTTLQVQGNCGGFHGGPLL